MVDSLFRASGLVMLVCGTLGVGCSKGAGPADGRAGAGVPPAAVRVAAAETRRVPIQLQGVGAVEPYRSVSVRSQVSGELQEVLFAEGDRVAKGQLLFRIDPRPFEAALRQARANEARSRALVEQAKANAAESRAKADNARTSFERDKALLDRGSLSQEEFDAARTNVEMLAAAVVADEATVRSNVESIRSAEAAVADAELMLGYCAIRAPIDGKTGSLLVHPGNLVRANDVQALVVINQIAPAQVSFTLPEKSFGEVVSRMAHGALETRAFIPGQEDHPAIGVLTFIDNAVDRAAGVFRLKATFPNEDERLWPGQFVHAVMTVAVLEGATSVPAQAVQTGQSGTFVYLVKSDMTVEARSVVAGERFEGFLVIKDGVRPGDQVVIDGQLRLAPGAKVKIIGDADPDATAGSTG